MARRAVRLNPCLVCFVPGRILRLFQKLFKQLLEQAQIHARAE